MRQIKTHEDGCGLTELCEVHALDEPHPVNGAHHHYSLNRLQGDNEPPEAFVFGGLGLYMEVRPGGPRCVNAGAIYFQNGPRFAPDSKAGTLDGAVLAVLIDRLECFQAGPFACAENEEVLKHLRAAAELLKARARERAARGVLGRNEK